MMEDIQHKIRRDLINENGILPSNVDTASPDAYSTTSDTPTPPNGIHDGNWATRYESIGVCEEQRQLLGTEEESSDKHSSDGEADISDVWTITEEQHVYYETQFKSLQPDLNGLINGFDARTYFEKSKLPVEDLRKIWQLSDVTKDGALSLAEFKIAMHLVVLKRNDIHLPVKLPQSLVATVPTMNNTSAVTNSSPPLSNAETSPQMKGKEWTKFVDSPTSTLSSPGPKPVNFDFQRPSVEQNPKILHPVAVRATPIPEHAVDEVKNDMKKINITDQATSSETGPIKPIQRPQPKKPTAPGPGAIPPPPHINQEDSVCTSGPTSLPVIPANKKEPPPPPPPRPTRTHFRSSSLDLNKLGKINNSVPTIPPRSSPGVSPPEKLTDGQLTNNSQFADFSQQCYHGAFQVYKRTDSKTNSELPTQEKKVVVPEICLEEKNRYLRKVCQELQEELNALREERIALQFKLEKLHARSPVHVHSPL